MKVFHRVRQLLPMREALRGCAVAIGNYDGIHRGHQRLLDKVLVQAQTSQVPSCLLTFFPHPVEVLRPGVEIERLTTASEKLELLKQLGLHTVLIQEFSKALADFSPEEFFKHFLVDGFGAGSVHVGFNFRFGKDRAGDTKLLQQLCDANGTHLYIENKFECDGQTVSSTAIRKALKSGDVRLAASLLGRPYSVSGLVVSGRAQGRKLGFRTANLSWPKGKLLPGDGVYACQALWQHQWYWGVVNIGVRPTISENHERSVEIHLIDGFEADLYDEPLTVNFCDFLRKEVKFNSVDELKTQIASDVNRVKQLSQQAPKSTSGETN